MTYNGIKFHLRIFALGVAMLCVIIAFGWTMTLLPLWVAETPLLILSAYMLGRMAYIWAKRP